MTPEQGLVLGAVQGVTEFLPISSTAHLRVVPAVLGWPDPGSALTAVLQLGTLVAVVGYFLPDFVRLARAGLGAVRDPARRSDPDVRLGLAIVLGTVPIVVVGLLAKDWIRGVLRGLPVIAVAMIVVAFGLLFIERRARQGRDLGSLTVRDGLLIGVAQALALVPGTSRSGITLLAALALGFARPDAARFSFLLSVPAVTAAGVFELPHVLRADGDFTALVVGLVAAAVTGYASIAWLLRFLRTRTTVPFAIYRIVVGAVLLVGALAGWLS